MGTTRRDFLTSAVTLAGATTMSDDRAHAEEHPHQEVPSDLALRVKSLESLLVEKGLVDRAAIDAMVDIYENKVGPRNGARVVARAWMDSAFKQRLLTNGTAAIVELGYSGEQGQDITVVENTPKVHNLIVCTLCSCYPCPVLGLPPVWYKSAPYRSRAVIVHAACCASWGPSCRAMSRCGCGTAPQKSGTWCCPSGRLGPRHSARKLLRPWLLATP